MKRRISDGDMEIRLGKMEVLLLRLLLPTLIGAGIVIVLFCLYLSVVTVDHFMRSPRIADGGMIAAVVLMLCWLLGTIVLKILSR